jgi:hypothetical protein
MIPLSEALQLLMAAFDRLEIRFYIREWASKLELTDLLERALAESG